MSDSTTHSATSTDSSFDRRLTRLTRTRHRVPDARTSSLRPRIKTPKRRGVENGERFPSPADCGVWGRCKLPQRGSGRSHGRIRFCCFMSVSKRVSLPRLFAIRFLAEYDYFCICLYATDSIDENNAFHLFRQVLSLIGRDCW